MLHTSRVFTRKWKGGLALLAFSLVVCLLMHPAYAAIPEPGIVIYGKVYDANGALLTSGELEWTFTPTAGGDPLTVSTQLTQIESEGGPYSYRIIIPLESDAVGGAPSGDAIPISDTPQEYTRVATLKGTSITRTDTITISTASRGTFEHVSIGSPAITDTDNDGLDDGWEQAIIGADPDDDITSLNDVNPGDDFDNDGETNGDEYYNGTDPTDAFSTFSYDNMYRSFHFEIYRGAEQTGSDSFDESFWGARLVCWPRDGETIASGDLTKPDGTSGQQVISLAVTAQGDEANMEESNYSSLTELMGDYVPGQYRVKLVMDNGGQDPYALRFKIDVPGYDALDFPEYITVSPSVGQTDVSPTPLLQFDTGIWDYLGIAKAVDGEVVYFHFRDNNDIPADTHQVPQSSALPWGLDYTLWVDTNIWGNGWLGSQTTVAFSVPAQPCDGDFDQDGDVDGLDLYSFDFSIDLQSFALDYGKTGCRRP